MKIPGEYRAGMKSGKKDPEDTGGKSMRKEIQRE